MVLVLKNAQYCCCKYCATVFRLECYIMPISKCSLIISSLLPEKNSGLKRWYRSSCICICMMRCMKYF